MSLFQMYHFGYYSLLAAALILLSVSEQVTLQQELYKNVIFRMYSNGLL